MTMNNRETPPAAANAEMSVVNLAARQRMLSQRLVLQIVLAVQGDAQQASAAEQTLSLFSDSQARLLDAVRQLPAEEAQPLHEVYFGPQSIGQQVQSFIGQCGRALRGRDPQALAEVVASSGTVLAALNTATSAFDALSSRRQRLLMSQLREIVGDIRLVAREAKVVSFNAQVIAARAGVAGREFAVVASTLSKISGEVDSLAHKGMALTKG